MTLRLVLFVLAVSACACAASQSRRDAQSAMGTLRICAKPAQGNLEIDETHVGPLGMFCEKGVLLPPGTHRIVATASYYIPEYRLVEVEDGKVVTVELELREVPL